MKHDGRQHDAKVVPVGNGTGAAAGFDIQDHVQDLRSLLDVSTTGKARRPIGASQAMISLLGRATRYANSSATVLLTGESGTGKEVLARWIHDHSRRQSSPYIRINCAALPAPLIESELFGHERGSFTGAVQARQGRLAAAGDGTVLLDEISEMDLGLQAKLLRVLEEEEFQPVGRDTSLPLRARFIATSNRELKAEIRDGKFREDLYYRLNVLHLHLPPLRERRADIRALVQHFIATFRDEAMHAIQGIDRDALAMLIQHPWPGNIRQLRNVVHRACVVSESSVLRLEDFEMCEQASSDRPALHDQVMTLRDMEREAIFRALHRNQGIKEAAAEELGISSRTLRNKLSLYRAEPRGRAA